MNLLYEVSAGAKSNRSITLSAVAGRPAHTYKLLSRSYRKKKKKLRASVERGSRFRHEIASQRSSQRFPYMGMTVYKYRKYSPLVIKSRDVTVRN